MKESRVSKIIGIAQDIKHFENSLLKIEGVDDPVSELMRFQFQHSKDQLIKDLIVELLQSGIDFQEIEVFLSRLMVYLSRNNGQGEKLSPLVQSSLQEVERLVAIP